MKLDCRIPAQWPAILLALVALAFVGCGKIQNPHQDARERRGWLFFNYSIVNTREAANESTATADTSQLYAGMTLRLLVWTNYLPTNVLGTFSQRFGANVTVTCYDSNEELHERLVGGGHYDLVMPAGFMVQRLIEEGLAAELNQARIPNLKNLDPDFHTNVFDPGSRHAIPYLWSTAGIAYNFDQLDHIPHSWGDLLIPDPPHQAQLTGRISLLPGPVRAIAAALLHLGHSPNENATNNLEAAGQLLERQMGTLHFRFLGTKLVNALDHGDILMAEAYSSEAERARRHNPHINFALPEDGVWLTIDHLVIPKATDARHQALAETFINYLLDPVVAAKVVNYSFHATTVSEARAFVDAEIRLGPPYSRPNHIVVQTFDREGDAYRQLLWRRLTNAFNVPAAL